MAYCTRADLINRAAEQSITDLTDDNGTTAIDEAKLDAAIALADSMIDSYLRGRYTVPISSPPAIIMGLSTDIAYYRLRLRLGMDDETLKAYEDAKKTLTDISKGVVTLQVTGAPASEVGGSSTVIVSRPRLFTKELLDKRP